MTENTPSEIAEKIINAPYGYTAESVELAKAYQVLATAVKKVLQQAKDDYKCMGERCSFDEDLLQKALDRGE